MAELDAKTDSFISLLLDVSGRARPGDLQGLSPSEAAEALKRYVSAHPERALAVDGDAIVPAGSTPVAGPSAPAPAASDDGMFEFGPAPAAPEPATAIPAPGPAFPIDGGVASGDIPAPSAASTFGVPTPQAEFAASVPGVPESMSFEPRDVPASTGDFVELPPIDGVADAADIPQRVPVYWWVLAVVLGWLGGLVGWLVLRRANPKGARTVLVVGIAVTVLSVVLAVGAFFMGAAAFFGIAQVEQVPVTPVPVSTSATGSAESSVTTGGAEATATP